MANFSASRISLVDRQVNWSITFCWHGILLFCATNHIVVEVKRMPTALARKVEAERQAGWVLPFRILSLR
jgi:hypothetical protein